MFAIQKSSLDVKYSKVIGTNMISSCVLAAIFDFPQYNFSLSVSAWHTFGLWSWWYVDHNEPQRAINIVYVSMQGHGHDIACPSKML